jgi:membrane protein DedA with SNARE-associated domain
VIPAPDLVVSPARRRFVLVLSLSLFVLGTIGSNVGPAWVDERPVTVLLMSSRNRNLLGSVPYIDLLPYAIIGFCRVLLAGVALYFLGKWYGTKALQWAEGQIGELPAVYGWFQRAIDRAGWLMLVLMPGSNLVCLMAGHRRMRLDRFLAFISVGIALKLVVLWLGGKQFEEQIVWFLDAINGYQWWIVAGLFGVTFLQSARKVRQSLPEIVDEIETPDGVIPPHQPHHRFGPHGVEPSAPEDDVTGRAEGRAGPEHGGAVPTGD